MSEQYLLLDERINALDNLIRSHSFLLETKENNFAWKWFIIAFHGAIYSFMLLALKQSDGSGVWDNLKGKKLVMSRAGTPDFGSKKNKLINFMTAFDWIQQQSRMSGCINSKPFMASEKQKAGMKELNDNLRNWMAHCPPVAWGASASYIVDICLPLVDLVTFLTDESGRIPFNEEEGKEVKTHTASIKSLLNLYKQNE